MSKRKFYRHYKATVQDSIAGCYEEVGTVHDANTDELMTVYRACYGVHVGTIGYVRPAHEFYGMVDKEPRFNLIITDPDLIARCIAATDLLYGY
jgi:hypothetical protein